MMFRCCQLWCSLCVALILSGCTAPRSHQSNGALRPFEFSRDTFSFPNELLWTYELDPATGKMTTRQREPKPDYALHCFVLVRSARQFHDCARFDPGSPKLRPEQYRPLVRHIAKCDPRAPPDRNCPVTIPGYENLREFSADHESLLKSELGGAWQSYLQRGNWRMVFPFTRRHQNRTAEQLLDSLRNGRAPIVHLARFPRLNINHVVLVIDAIETSNGIRFLAYDPNNADSPTTLDFDRVKRTFHFPANDYFTGGPVNAYEICRGFFY